MKRAFLKRLLAVAAGLLMIAGVLAGCGGPSAGGEADTSGTSAGQTAEGPQTVSGKIKYNFWGDANQLEAINKQIEEFNIAYPEVTVEANASDWGTYWEKLRKESAGGEAPDTFAMSTTFYLPFFAQKNFLADCGELDGKDDAFDLGMYNRAALELCSYDGKVLSLPQDMNAIALAYNVDMFKAAGVNPPTDNWTWDDLLEAARLTTLDENGNNAASPDFDSSRIVQYGIANMGDYTDAFIDPLAYSNGGSLFTDDGRSNILDEKTQKSIGFVHDLIHKYHVAPTFDVVGGSWFSNDLFAQSKAAISALPSYWLFNYSEADGGIGINFEAFELPKGDSGKRYNAVQSKAISIYSGSNNIDAAWTFAKFIAGRETAAKVAASGSGMSAIDEVNETVFMNEAPGSQTTKQVFINAFNNACPVPKVVGFGDVNWLVGNDYFMNLLMRDPVYKEETLQRLDSEVNKLFDDLSD